MSLNHPLLSVRMLGGICLSLVLASTTQAHNVVAGAYVDGMLVEGEIGLSNGEMALPGIVVEVLDSQGNKLAETRTTEGGLFTYQATQVVEHHFKADMGAGHVASILVTANEFASGNNLSSSVAAGDMAADTTNAELRDLAGSTAVTGGNTLAMNAQQLERIVRQAVAQQVKPLQKELRAYKEKVMFRDIAGGLGFIFGLFGVAAWLTARKTPSPTQEAS